jgi:hypothetical protein
MTSPEEPDDGQLYIDRSKIDFDPADGLYSGTAVDGTTEIPGPHEHEQSEAPDDDEGLGLLDDPS